MNSCFRPLLAAVVLAAVHTASAVAQHSAVDPQPRTDDWWKQRHEALNRRSKEAGSQAQVVFIGDSITQGWEGEGKDVWAKYYGPRHALNLGIGGDRTQHVLWRLGHGNLEGLKPKAAVVMIGTNNSNGEDNTPGQIVDGVRAIVNHLRTTLPDTKVLLLAIFPRNENYSPIRGKLAQVNQVLRKLADDQHVFWADLGAEFLNLDGTIPQSLMPDFLHLSPRGYDIWAASIDGRLTQLLGDSVLPAAPGIDLSGNWLWTIAGPDGKPVTAPLLIKSVDSRVTGFFSRPDGRELTIEEGKLVGDRFTWVAKRDRPDGSIMIYEMSGRLVDGKIEGQAKTTFNGQEITTPWSARKN